MTSCKHSLEKYCNFKIRWEDEQTAAREGRTIPARIIYVCTKCAKVFLENKVEPEFIEAQSIMLRPESH